MGVARLQYFWTLLSSPSLPHWCCDLCEIPSLAHFPMTVNFEVLGAKYPSAAFSLYFPVTGRYRVL